MRAAIITGLDLAEDGVLLVQATCEACSCTVLHGAGSDLDAPVLGVRLVHCKCRDENPGASYQLADPDRVVPLRLRVLRRQADGIAEDFAVAAHRRRIEDAEEGLRRAIADTADLHDRHPARLRLRREARASLEAARAAYGVTAEATG